MKSAVVMSLVLCVAACGTIDKQPEAALARGPAPAPPPPPAPRWLDYCKPNAQATRFICDNNIKVKWTSKDAFVVSVDHEPFVVPRPGNPALGGLPLVVRWTLPPRADTDGNFVFIVPRGDGILLKEENGEFDDGSGENADDGGQKRFRWRITKKFDNPLGYAYSIVFHRKASGSVTHKIVCDPRMVDLPESLVVTLSVDLTDCRAFAP